MTDKLRKAAQDVVHLFDMGQIDDCTYEGNKALDALREAIAEPSPIDALIAELGELETWSDGYGEATYISCDYGDVVAILAKYGSKK